MPVAEHFRGPGVNELRFLLMEHERFFQVDFYGPGRRLLHDRKGVFRNVIGREADKYRKKEYADRSDDALRNRRFSEEYASDFHKKSLMVKNLRKFRALRPLKGRLMKWFCD